MLRKVIDNFAIDTFGWFSEDFSTPHSTHSSLTRPAADIWSLWVRKNTNFSFKESSSTSSRSLIQTAQDLRDVLTRSQASPRKPHETDEYIIESFFTLCDYDRKPHSLASFRSQIDHFTHNNVEKSSPLYVCLPNYLISPKTVASVADNYLLSDAITGCGLEAYEATRTALFPLQFTGIKLLTNIYDHFDKHDPSTFHRTREAVIAQCTIDIWWALQIRSIRNEILSSWPGWAEIFSAQDKVLMPSAESMQSFVSKKSPFRSDLRRFCMALAWNINPHNERVSFPKSMSSAYDWAVTQWPGIESTPDLNGDKLQAIYELVTGLSVTLNHEEKIPEKSTQLSGSNTQHVDGKPTKFRSNSRSTNSGADLLVEPRTEEPGTENNCNIPAVFMPPTNWSGVSHCQSLVESGRESRAFQAKHRRDISDEISASAWFVPNPPPLEHGNLDGTLDEGNLLRFAAFSDPNIFSISPESGHGQIVLGILVDASGSMDRALQDLGVSAMQAACCFVGGVKDGLARNPNVKVAAFAYDSRTVNPGPDMRCNFETPPGAEHRLIGRMDSVKMGNHVCALRRLDTDDDLIYTQPLGGTPTATALRSLDEHLASLHPEAQRIILILTDGAPCGTIDHPLNDPELNIPEFHDSEDETRKAVSAIPTPIFCVGLGVGATTLQKQYNVGHSFTVDTPLSAVRVAADLVRKIGASLNC